MSVYHCIAYVQTLNLGTMVTNFRLSSKQKIEKKSL